MNISLYVSPHLFTYMFQEMVWHGTDYSKKRGPETNCTQKNRKLKNNELYKPQHYKVNVI